MMSAEHLHPVQRHAQRPTRYCSVTSVSEALDLLHIYEANSRVVAGATDLLVEIDRGARTGVETLIDISRITGASDVHIQNGVARLGPLTTHNDIISNPDLVTGALPLAQACWEVGSPQLRNRATVVGNIVTASPANDTISALVALGAQVELSSVAGTRSVGIEGFITGFRSTVLQPTEMVTAIEIPLLQPNQRGIFVKLGNRSAQAISVVHLAVVLTLDGDIVTDARIAVGSVAPTVQLLPAAQSAIIGKSLHDLEARSASAQAAQDSISPISDVRATAQYRNDTVGVVLARALGAIADGQERSQWMSAPPTLRSATDNPRWHANWIMDGDSPIESVINGNRVVATGQPGQTLLDWLREDASLPGTKEGCAEGECGACTVRLDGNAVMSCLVPAGRAHHATITTVEGLSETAVGSQLQDAFVDCFAVQCGFCIPGFLVAGTALLEETPDPTPEQIRAGLAGNLCRCTGYYKIIDAVEKTSRALTSSSGTTGE